jgi:hypothetical protein
MVSSYIGNLSRNLDWYAEWLIQGNLTPYKKKEILLKSVILSS